MLVWSVGVFNPSEFNLGAAVIDLISQHRPMLIKDSTVEYIDNKGNNGKTGKWFPLASFCYYIGPFYLLTNSKADFKMEERKN